MVVVMLWSSILATAMLAKPKLLWPTSTTHGFVVAFLSLGWFFSDGLHYSTEWFLVDKISAPLMILSSWLFPLTLLASQSKMIFEPIFRQRVYIANAAFLQLGTLLAFMSADMMMFFIFFETSLIPTMIIITRWGAQNARFEAGYYFTFYTILGATPLITLFLYYYSSFGTLRPSPENSMMMWSTTLAHPTLVWLGLNIAFLVKLPLYGLHLWLPKAHVEAPVAGSMVLAATLLKLGGYGMIRTSTMLEIPLYNTALAFMALALCGIITTSLMCYRLTDLKALIAMSSVSHMNMVVVAALINTPLSFSGATTMMIAHGLTSSALFCLANTLYERTNSRTIIILRGAMVVFPLAGAWWLMFVLMNMAFPPTINFIAEAIIFIAVFNWSNIVFFTMVIVLVLTSGYSLYILAATMRGPFPLHVKVPMQFAIREHVLIALHLVPAILLITCPPLLMV
uniref:NADH dehydrogenase subunit 4 n=1 Tax=Ptychadena nuerensis TaxID=2039362 RepID=UPI00286D01F9|nr:NADH dehydrogenase subunit 4 [Ptychadena nuerensis]WKT09035.1 NADH dehydrogenase subunit 4 [Ptychadena nuerensis]